VSQLIATLHQLRAPYDSNTAKHEELLMKLWGLLRPDVRLSNRISKEWEEIGFQGHDPATDFRGMGLLGLHNLVDFAERYPQKAKAILFDSAKSNWFSFAITGINLTADCLQLTSHRQVNSFYYQNGCGLEQFNKLYGIMFVRFNAAWQKANPKNVMSFTEIHNQFLTDIRRDAQKGKLVQL
jgi:hypothetical protein